MIFNQDILGASDFEIPWRFSVGYLSVLDNEFENFKKDFSVLTFGSKSEKRNSFTKFELRNTEELRRLRFVRKIYEWYLSDECTAAVEKKLGFSDIWADESLDGGGLTLTPSGHGLRYHVDFPFSNSARGFRVANLIVYLSNCDGGRFQLLDPGYKTVEAEIVPEATKFCLFPTSEHTPHGHSMVRSGQRLSFNLYFYAERPLDNRFQPAKTEWII